MYALMTAILFSGSVIAVALFAIASSIADLASAIGNRKPQP